MPKIIRNEYQAHFDHFEDTSLSFRKLPLFLFTGRFSGAAKYHVPKQSHDSYAEILYVKSGDNAFVINGKKYNAKPGDLVVFNRNVPHEEFYSFTADMDVEVYYCGINSFLIEGLADLCIIPAFTEPVFSTLSYDKKVNELILDLFREASRRDNGYLYVCNSIVTELIILINRIVDEQTKINNPLHQNSAHTLVENTKKLLDENYTKKITLDQLSSELSVSKYYISHTFKKLSGDSPIKYLINRRLEEAERLLRVTKMPIYEIAIRLGYDNPNHFYLPFKNRTGLTPEEYRKKHAHLTYENL